MITVRKMEQLMNINADQLTDMMSDAGYPVADEPFINTHFDGISTTAGNCVNFVYQGMYLDIHGEGGFQYARVIVSYNADTGVTSIDYAA